MTELTPSIISGQAKAVRIRKSHEDLAHQTAAFFQKGVAGAANTQTAYASDIEQLELWLQTNELGTLPISSGTLAAYLSDQATVHKWATLTRRLAAIRKWHRGRKHPDPGNDEAVRLVLEGIKRSIGTEPDQAPAFDIEKLKECTRTIAPTPTGLRDKAMLLVCFAGAFRRSELVALDIDGVKFTREGAILSYQGSKTNQYGRREEKALFFSPDPATCPVRAIQDYMALLNRTSGPLFVRIRKQDAITEDRLSDKQVARVTKQYLGDDYSAHSHRASFVTIAKLNGADDSQIMQQTKHRTRTMIDRYTRVQEVVKHNAAMKLGL
ncbi:Integrase/recombinase xerD-like protein (plasmid) [Fibrella aestuarina BUZ 2]|uniref:Integrase/recombinase xerD-like protein n=1 Tax=Fibrella aestuarina BUZ 2 TaxID=1166018 RepID=I0KHH1_9BACT|nr:site-specific integrase [Fibrella aestuarina]CCH03574.1 Integrase/recombinase xerD-like protein [Fibrella aestuarina BUZ 2]